MKKKLLFSLLLGSAFSWMNGMYAADAVKVDATAKEKPTETDKGSTTAPEKYKIKTTDGKDQEISIHKKRDDLVYKNVVIMDGAYTNFNIQKVRKVTGLDVPFVPGQEMPKGYIIVNFFFKPKDGGKYKDLYGKTGKTCDADFSTAIIQTTGTNNPAAPDGYASPDEFTWALMDEKTGEIFIPEMYLEPSNEKFYGNQKDDNGVIIATNNKARSFYIPDPAELESVKIKKTDLETLKAGGGGTTAPAANSAGNPKFAELAAIIDSAQKQSAKAAEELKVLLAGTHTNNGSALSQVLTIKGVELTIVSTDPAALKNPSLFAQYADGVVAMLSKYPQVAAALIAQMAPDSVPGKVDTLSESRLADTLKENGTDVTISGSLSFASSVTPEQARKLRNELMETYGSNKQAVPTAPMAPALVAPVAISSASAVPDVIPAGLSPLAEQLLKRKSQLKKVETGTAATEINAEIAKSAIKDAELAAAEAEKVKLEAELAATRAVAASALEAAQKNQAQEDANAAKLKETLIQANAIITAKDAETAQVVATANAELAKKDDEKAQVVASANAIIQQTGAEKAQLEKQATELAGKHEEVTKKLDEAQSTIIDIAKANANPATTAPLVVQENVHEAPASSTTVAPTTTAPTLAPVKTDATVVPTKTLTKAEKKAEAAAAKAAAGKAK